MTSPTKVSTYGVNWRGSRWEVDAIVEGVRVRIFSLRKLGEKGDAARKPVTFEGHPPDQYFEAEHFPQGYEPSVVLHGVEVTCGERAELFELVRAAAAVGRVS